jgi:hypothetical protein
MAESTFIYVKSSNLKNGDFAFFHFIAPNIHFYQFTKVLVREEMEILKLLLSSQNDI